MIGSALAAPVAIIIGPLGHFDGVNDVAGQGGHHNGHGGGAAAVIADVVGAVGLVGIPFIVLVEVDHLHRAVCETDVCPRRGSRFQRRTGTSRPRGTG